jgi:hypothetical protein
MHAAAFCSAAALAIQVIDRLLRMHIRSRTQRVLHIHSSSVASPTRRASKAFTSQGVGALSSLAAHMPRAAQLASHTARVATYGIRSVGCSPVRPAMNSATMSMISFMRSFVCACTAGTDLMMDTWARSMPSSVSSEWIRYDGKYRKSVGRLMPAAAAISSIDALRKGEPDAVIRRERPRVLGRRREPAWTVLAGFGSFGFANPVRLHAKGSR